MIQCRCRLVLAAVISATLLPLQTARAEDATQQQSGFWSWFSGDWSLSLGAAGFVAPSYEGASDMALSGMPLISLNRAGATTRFSSRNDNASFGLFDVGTFRIGPTGKLLLPRDDGTSSDLRGLDSVPWGVEVGAFAEYYPTDWLRVRGEVRQGFHAHHGVVADLAADVFTDLTPVVRLSGGPRVSLASASYFEAYYGVNLRESAASGLAPYSPGGGFKSVGVGGALTWQATDKITTSAFSEYSRLVGPAADSSLVKQKGSVNQLLIGISATYRFDFTL